MIMLTVVTAAVVNGHLWKWCLSLWSDVRLGKGDDEMADEDRKLY